MIPEMSDTVNKFITPDDNTRIKQFIDIFKTNKTYELEVAFKNIDYPNYMRIIDYYIKTEKDITESTSLDISIMLPENNTYRISLLDDDLYNKFLQTYLKASVIEIQKYLLSLDPSDMIEIMFKDRGTAERLIKEDFDFIVKVTKETPLSDTIKKPVLTGSERILYRYKHRVTFHRSDIKIDITDVKETTVMFNLNKKPSIYELELEVISNKITANTLVNHVHHIITVIQDSDIIIGKQEERHVINDYQTLLGLKNITHLEARNVISIENQHIVKFLPNKYAVTDKADGERYQLFVGDSSVYLISTNLIVKKTAFVVEDPVHRHMILDGELIRNDHGYMYLAFDVIYSNNVDYRNNKYILPDRIKVLNNIIDTCFHNLIPFEDYTNKHEDVELKAVYGYNVKELKKYWLSFRKKLKNTETLFITSKLYFIPYGINKSEVFKYADMIYKLYVYDELPPYKLDGIIYTPISSPYMIKATRDNLDSEPMEYKWKRPSENSIDFFVKFELDDRGNEAVYYDNALKSNNSYKICRLYVGLQQGSQEKPIPFKINGVEQTANIYLTDNEPRDSQGRIISDNTVVEFAFNTALTDKEDAYKWIPLRTRYDKTESVLKYKKKYGNNLHIAQRIWKTIINPITEERIASLGNPATYQREMELLNALKPARYYQKDTKTAKGMRAFNNWIKANLITTYCKGMTTVLDVGCGRGGDLNKFIHTDIKEYVGIDIDNDGLYVINDSAHKRYLNFKRTRKDVPVMTFIQADARGLLNVAAQENIMPQMTESNKKLLKLHFAKNKRYDVINCQFALHYFLADALSWSNFCTNLNNHMASNGYLLITCFDGELIYNHLKGLTKYPITYTDGHGNDNLFFEIIKVYNDADRQQLGLAIDLYNSLISNEGVYIREYLVFPDFLEKSLKDNCKLELVETDTFENLFNLYKIYFNEQHVCEFLSSNISMKNYDDIKEFYQAASPDVSPDSLNLDQIAIYCASYKLAMLNRYYVFKKTALIDISEPSRVIALNHNINLGPFLMPYFYSHQMSVDYAKRTTRINDLYHPFKKHSDPTVYLIRHTIDEGTFNDEVYQLDNLSFTNIRQGSDAKTLIIYKSPEKSFYPIYYGNHRYLMESSKVVNDLDILVALTKRHR